MKSGICFRIFLWGKIKKNPLPSFKAFHWHSLVSFAASSPPPIYESVHSLSGGGICLLGSQPRREPIDAGAKEA